MYDEVYSYRHRALPPPPEAGATGSSAATYKALYTHVETKVTSKAVEYPTPKFVCAMGFRTQSPIFLAEKCRQSHPSSAKPKDEQKRVHVRPPTRKDSADGCVVCFPPRLTL